MASRTDNSLKNIKFAIIGQVCGLLVGFLARAVFVKILSAEYLGINGLFSNILSILSLAELGIGSAMVYSMYKPLAANDTKKVAILMKIYKKAYSVIGIVVLSVGLVLTPFLSLFINNMPDIPEIKLYYVMYVINSALAYFFSYKRSLIIADQKRYIATIYRYGLFVICSMVQCIALYITHNYTIYLVVQLCSTLLENIAISSKADKMYPYLKEKVREGLPGEEKRELIKNIKAMSIHQLGNVLVQSTDNLLISRMVSLVSVGIYSNYFMITNALNVVYGLIYNSVTASVGNLCATESSTKIKQFFEYFNFALFWLYAFSAICLVTLFNPFITIWVGKEYLFSMDIVLVIALNFYLYGMRRCIVVFRNAMGIFWYDRYKALLEAILNLVFSIYLGRLYGIIGIFAGTIVSTIFANLLIEPRILFKYGFKISSLGYYYEYLKYTIVFIIVGGTTYGVTGMIKMDGWWSFVLKAVICVFMSNILFLLIFARNKNFKFIMNRVFRKLGKK